MWQIGSNLRHLKVDKPAPLALTQQSVYLELSLGCQVPWKLWQLGDSATQNLGAGSIYMIWWWLRVCFVFVIVVSYELFSYDPPALMPNEHPEPLLTGE